MEVLVVSMVFLFAGYKIGFIRGAKAYHKHLIEAGKLNE